MANNKPKDNKKEKVEEVKKTAKTSKFNLDTELAELKKPIFFKRTFKEYLETKKITIKDIKEFNTELQKFREQKV